jgi:protein unc-119
LEHRKYIYYYCYIIKLKLSLFFCYRVEFTVGNKPVNNFLMIERHYYGEKLLKNFEFNFGFAIPNSRNTFEHIYEVPELSDSDIKEMIKNPYLTRSDSFYFVDNKLIMHNKADYSFSA